MKKFVLIIVSVFIVVGALAVFPRITRRIERMRLIAEQENIMVPDAEPLPIPQSSASAVAFSSSASSAFPVAVNYEVPFTLQAPLAQWDDIHQEACEEASVLMVLRFFQGREIGSPEEADTALTEILLQNEALGFPVDDTAEQVVTLIQSLDSSIDAVVVEDPTVEQIKKALAQGVLVIVPAQGQQLGNPYFTAPGPRYHMLVIKGYTDDGYFITNDPGTKRGKNYVYRFSVLMNAIHDWNGGDVESGAKRVIFVGRDLIEIQK